MTISLFGFCIMSQDILPVNFTISAAAKQAIAQIRADHDAQFPGDPAAVLSVAWGLYREESGSERFENVVIGFYTRSMLGEVAHAIQRVSGLDLIFFTTQELRRNFAGKILDHADERGFFLRNPT
jgi:hypothetical protein